MTVLDFAIILDAIIRGPTVQNAGMVFDMTLTDIDILLVGHIAADVVAGGFRLGGTVAYAAATAHAFGLRVGVVTSARAADPLLEEVRRFAQVVNIPAEHSTTFENIYTDDGRVQYWRAKANDLTAEHIPVAWRGTPLIHLAPLADEIHASVLHVIPAEGRVMVTPQGWMRRRGADDRVQFKPWFDEQVLQRVDLLVFSVEDVAAAPEMTDQYTTAARRSVVTDGKTGGTLYHGDGTIAYAAVPVQAIDPTGAGDIFALSLFALWARLHDLKQAIRGAAYLAAQSTTRPGLAGTPTSDEIAQAITYAGQ